MRGSDGTRACCAESCGVLYVEHELLPDAFPASRIKILAMLSSQIAISIENSALYEQVRHSLSLWLAIAFFIATSVERESFVNRCATICPCQKSAMFVDPTVIRMVDLPSPLKTARFTKGPVITFRCQQRANISRRVVFLFQLLL